MNNKLMSVFTEYRTSRLVALENLNKIEQFLSKFTIETTDTSYIWLATDKVYITVYNREDLMTWLQVAPTWSKKVCGRGIEYTFLLDTITFEITAYDSALPPTCHVVEEKVTVPAKAAYTYTTISIKCDVPLESMETTK